MNQWHFMFCLSYELNMLKMPFFVCLVITYVGKYSKFDSFIELNQKPNYCSFIHHKFCCKIMRFCLQFLWRCHAHALFSFFSHALLQHFFCPSIKTLVSSNDLLSQVKLLAKRHVKVFLGEKKQVFI